MRDKLKINDDAVKVINDFLLDENNPLVNQLLAVVEKYGPEHMAEIGRKGGEHSHGGHEENDNDNNKRSSDDNKSGSKRGLASADKETREKVAKKGGESSHRD